MAQMLCCQYVRGSSSGTSNLQTIQEEMEQKAEKFDSNQSTCRKKKKRSDWALMERERWIV
jgi:hypothetical protein